MMRLFFILLINCFLFLSCTKEAKVKLPEAKPLPVMYSYICPIDSVIRLKLMSSSPLFSSNQIAVLAAVSDGDVKISSAQGTAQLIFNQNTGYYELKTNAYPIMPGQVYKMTVTTSNGDVATAETQVPLTTVSINAVTVETVAANYSTYDHIKVSFTDELGRLNYYRIAALHAYAYTSQADTIANDTRIIKLYSDLNHDGENVSLDGRFDPTSDSTQYYSTEYYDVFLYNCSESYYKFYKSLENDSGSGISFPPPAEPTLMYSNVKGGFGCFGAYTRSVLRYKKK
ncbi:MAG: DUF4249 domain-containing protein [Bacteroidetes bacterium]|nr:DUF4249 domain-containing protein [Bacteroidota bacterium]